MSEKKPELTRSRELMYRLLSSIYIDEINNEMLTALRELELPAMPENTGSWQEDMRAGFELIGGHLAGFEGKDKEGTAALLEDLAADYAKTFLAAGDAAGRAAFPYETVYTGTDSMFGGSVQMQLNALYAANGFKMKEDMFKIMEDHIGLELCFMAELLALGREDEAAVFFNDHLINWVGRFTADVYKYSERDFYKGIARVTRGFIEAEKQLFAGVA